MAIGYGYLNIQINIFDSRLLIILLLINYIDFLFIYLVNQTNDIFAYSVWIGGSDLQENRVFVWSRNGDDFTFTNWLVGIPDNYQNSEHCVEMIAAEGKWNDRHCNHNTSFVCEKDIQ